MTVKKKTRRQFRVGALAAGYQTIEQLSRQNEYQSDCYQFSEASGSGGPRRVVARVDLGCAVVKKEQELAVGDAL